MPLSEVIGRVKSGPLTYDEAIRAMHSLLAEDTPDSQIEEFLTIHSARASTGEELAGFAHELRARSRSVALGVDQLIDTCGTGGGYPSFNISTGAAIVAAAAGAKIAKHGNRAVTSVCGSADVLEALGVTLHEDEATLCECMKRVGVAFLFAPQHHPALKRVAPIRKSLGFRTVFNYLGPLLNPAGAKRQLLGVFDEQMVQPMADASHILGSERTLVVRGRDGLDEISAGADTQVAVVNNGTVEVQNWTVEADFGAAPLDMLRVGPGLDASSSAALLILAISDVESPYARALLPNAAAVLWLSGISETLRDGYARSQDAIRSGAAKKTLEELRSI